MCRFIEKILRVRMENIKMSTVSTSKSFFYMFSYINICVYIFDIYVLLFIRNELII